MADLEKRDVQVLDTAGTPGSAGAHETAAERAAFLSSFTVKEDRAIRRKVDLSIIWLISVMYTLKNVRPPLGTLN